MRRWGLVGGLGLVALGVALPAGAQQVQTRPAHNMFATVGTAAMTIRPALAQRTLLILINDGSAVVYCRVDGVAATVNQGIRLGASGGSITFDIKVPEGSVSCISDSGSNRILITEGR